MDDIGAIGVFAVAFAVIGSVIFGGGGAAIGFAVGLIVGYFFSAR